MTNDGLPIRCDSCGQETTISCEEFDWDSIITKGGIGQRVNHFGRWDGICSACNKQPIHIDIDLEEYPAGVKNNFLIESKGANIINHDCFKDLLHYFKVKS